jgi:hypothetical protein
MNGAWNGDDENGGNNGEMAGTKPRGIALFGLDDVIFYFRCPVDCP